MENTSDKLKCRIKWVSKESGWQLTPDENDAVCFAISVQSGSDRETVTRPYPCCAEHQVMLRQLIRKGPDIQNYAGKTFRSEWKEESLT